MDEITPTGTRLDADGRAARLCTPEDPGALRDAATAARLAPPGADPWPVPPEIERAAGLEPSPHRESEVEYRIVGVDPGAAVPAPWRESEAAAMADVPEFLQGDVTYSEVWVESRPAVVEPPVTRFRRVKP